MGREGGSPAQHCIGSGKDLKNVSSRVTLTESEWDARCKDRFLQDKEVGMHGVSATFGQVTADQIDTWEVYSEDSEDGSDDDSSTSKASDEYWLRRMW